MSPKAMVTFPPVMVPQGNPFVNFLSKDETCNHRLILVSLESILNYSSGFSAQRKPDRSGKQSVEAFPSFPCVICVHTFFNASDARIETQTGPSPPKMKTGQKDVLCI